MTSENISPTQRQLLHSTIENWKRKLLDVSKRNRSLNFKPLRISTVTIIDALPGTVFSKLWVDDANLRFAAAELPTQKLSDEATDSLSDLEREAEPFQAGSNQQLEALLDTPESDTIVSEGALYANPQPEQRRTTNVLQTQLNEEQLDRSLRRLDEQTRLALEEQDVNILFLALGMLRYKESVDSSEVFQAPLILVPVELSRKTSRSGYVLGSSGDDPMVNPALLEYLRRTFSIALPELPDAASLGDGYDLQTFLAEVRTVVNERKEWAVTEDIHLALFSFQKFMMYKDLEQNITAIAAHRLIQQLVLKVGPQYNGLPKDIQTLDLDQALPPERTFQVVDADSSQLKAIAVVAKNLDLVMEGPPGTGKSQTITNLIALALASGRSVLFVAEKNAALKVVHQRLVKAGLGDFCLELHSTKANKRAVIRELARSLDASLQAPLVSTATAQKLPVVRERLTNYVKELHKPFGELNLSPYQVIGRYNAVIDAPRVKYVGETENISQEQISQTIQQLDELAEVSTLIGNPQVHPWRDTSRTYYSESDFENVAELCRQILTQVDQVHNFSLPLASQLGLPPLQVRSNLQDFIAVADVVARSPGAPAGTLASGLWDEAPPTEVLDLIRLGRDLQKRVQAVNLLFKPNVYDSEHSSDIKYVYSQLKGLQQLFAILDGRYRTIRKRWLGYRLPAFRGSLQVEAEQLKRVDQINLDRKHLAENEAKAKEYFGDLWQGENSDWDRLDRYATWVVEFRTIYRKHNLDPKVIDIAQAPAPDVSLIEKLQVAVQGLTDLLLSLGKVVGWPENYLLEAPLDEIKSRARELTERLHEAHPWIAFYTVRTKAAKGLGEYLIQLAIAGQLSFSDLASAFQRSFYQKWLDTVIQIRLPLLEFNTLLHEQRLNEFKDLDRNILNENRNRLIRKVRDDVQRRLQENSAVQAMPYLRREIARQRGLSPLRRTLKQASAAIRAIKPCFMMSPLTVAQHLDASQPGFDLVIFDEASQLPAEDAIGAISRAKQLVVVGDPKQLPPTNFFGVMSGQVSVVVNEEGQPMYEDGESILEELMAAGLATSRLKWHYRSAHESLIHFSNASFYESDLYTFPSVEFTSNDMGVSFEYVENGIYEGKGLNLIEARKVVDAVEEHARTFPQLSLGVGTFNLRQQLAIQDEIENRRRLNPELDSFCSQNHDEPFFVKNLENIQGDERDGRLRYNFGPINGENGWRRLNVLASRARRRMKVFSSIRAEDISLVGLTSTGARLLRDFILYAETGQIDQAVTSQLADTESPFEHDVYAELTRQGLTMVPQVGVAGYRIDFGVTDDTLPGRYICGIECDGVTYHASETARDRDRLRQEVLEGRGWLIYRIWSTDWFKDRTSQIARIKNLVQQARDKAKTQAALKQLQTFTNRQPTINQDEVRSNAEKPNDLNSDPADTINEVANLAGYIRPKAAKYQFAQLSASKGYDILDVRTERLAQVVVTIVETEGPIHAEELMDRIVVLWNTKAGKRIAEHVRRAIRVAVHTNLIERRNNFYFGLTDKVVARNHYGLKFPAEHIAPEEYREAVLLVLRTGYAFPRKTLIDEVRSMLGFGRTTAALEEMIGQAVDSLLSSGIAGDASTGIALRR
jgi:very-short-patch-repair endonuclease